MSDPSRDFLPHTLPTAAPAPLADTLSDGGAPADPGTPALAPPGYELFEEIGRGGMGIVFRGRDTDLNRDVAVKFLQPRYAPTSLAARRFLDEARITGQLQHPGIPPVHEVGTLPDGQPFLVMKLIKGETLADRLTVASVGRSELVAAFEQVCQAVAYAHDRGVVHRDLKPQNVMVGKFGEIQVMDWGLAKFRGARLSKDESSVASTFSDPRTDEDSEDLRTRTGSFLGTPAYMSPEQAIGAVDRIDERSDVFGLGAVLCSILTGEPPFVSATAESTRQLAAQGKLEPTFARLDACAAEPELAVLCKRCLAVDPGERPANAGAVAKAVAEFRQAADERARQAELDRVRAEAETREQHKRRKVQLALAAVVALLLAGGGVFAWWRADVKAEQARIDGERLTEDARRAEQEKSRLARNADALTVFVDRCERAIRADEAETAAAALTEIDRRLPEGGGEGLARRVARCRTDLVFLRGLDKIDQFRWTSVENQLPSRKAVAEKWQTAFAAGGLDVKALPAGDAVQWMADSLLHQRLVATLGAWLVLAPSAEVREILRRADPNPYRDEIRDAIVAKDENRVAELVEQAEALTQPNAFTAALGQHLSVPLERRRYMLERALRTRPGDLTLLLVRSYAYPDRSYEDIDVRLRLLKEDANEKVRWLQAAVAAHPRNATAHFTLGSVLNHKGDTEGAIAALKASIRLDPEYARAHYNLGIALHDKGDVDGAVTAYKEAVRLDPKDTAAHTNLGGALRAKGDVEGAIAAFKAAIRLDPRNPIAHNNLGLTLRATRDWDGAISAFREAIRLQPRYIPTYRHLAGALHDKGDWDGAIAAWKVAIRLDPEYAVPHRSLGITLRAKGDMDGAIAAFKEAIRLYPEYAEAYTNLGLTLRDKGDVEGAIAAWKDAIRLDPKNTHAQTNLGIAYFGQKKYLEAIECARTAIRADAKFANAHALLGEALQQTGDRFGARAALTEAVRLDARLKPLLAKLPPIPVAPPPRPVSR